MKHVLLAFSFFIAAFTLTAQNAQYVEMMKKSIDQIKYIATAEEIQDAANQLERIANVEKEEWLPNYYITYAYIILASKDMETGGTNIPSLVEKAEAALNKAKAIAGEENSEIMTMQGYLYVANIWSNPMANGAKYSPLAYAAFGKASALDPTNPRPHTLKAQNLFFTPEAFGGGKDAARPLFDKAKELFAAFKPASEIAPQWGNAGNEYFLNMYNEE